ncbi:MAG: hypothetical protein H7Z19_12605 [Chitinophagaceae bacterium]|nr:hypothetical protein [Rubrivivax sp.]
MFPVCPMRNPLVNCPVFIASLVLVAPFAKADLVEFEQAPAQSAGGPVDGWAMLIEPGQFVGSSTPGTMRILAATSGTAYRTTAVGQTFSSGLPDIGLWKFISTVRAQQTGSTLVLLESNLRILEQSTTGAPIPLPGTALFMVAGLLTLAGLKVAGRRGARSAPGTTSVGAAGA